MYEAKVMRFKVSGVGGQRSVRGLHTSYPRPQPSTSDFSHGEKNP